jgi:protein SCO1/2
MLSAPRFALLFLLLLTSCAAPRVADDTSFVQSGTVIEPPVPIAEFSLPASSGGTLGLADLRGKPTLLFFGFANCPDVCPTTLSEFKWVKEQLGAKGESVNFVFISVDAERDTPELLANHVRQFDPAFIGLQGDEATLRRIGTSFGLYYQKQPLDASASGYTIDHSAASYLLNADGALIMVYSYGTAADVIAADLRNM